MNTKLRVNADLFRIAYRCVDKDEPRFYLNGVHVESHPSKGVLLVATDGHRMIVIHDEHGETNEAAIVRLDRPTLKLCKPGKRDRRRELQVDENEVRVLAFEAVGHGERSGHSVATAGPSLVDGAFPDWRRILPACSEEGPKERDAYDSGFLADFGAIGVELARASDVTGFVPMLVQPTQSGSPALIRWGSIEHAFGVLMPLRKPDDLGSLPSFMDGRPAESQAA